MGGEGADDAVGEGGVGGGEGRGVCGDHVLFVEDELERGGGLGQWSVRGGEGERTRTRMTG